MLTNDYYGDRRATKRIPNVCANKKALGLLGSR
jgi:hypothetical protein